MTLARPYTPPSGKHPHIHHTWRSCHIYMMDCVSFTDFFYLSQLCMWSVMNLRGKKNCIFRLGLLIFVYFLYIKLFTLSKYISSHFVTDV